MKLLPQPMNPTTLEDLFETYEKPGNVHAPNDKTRMLLQHIRYLEMAADMWRRAAVEGESERVAAILLLQEGLPR